MSQQARQSTLRARLSRLEIQGFRSLRDVSLDLRPLTVMIGANGAGKSNLVRFFGAPGDRQEVSGASPLQ